MEAPSAGNADGYTHWYASLWLHHECGNPSESTSLWWRCKRSNQWKSEIRIHLSHTALASMVIPSGGGGGGVILMHIFGVWEEAGIPLETRVRGRTCCLYPERPLATGDSKLDPSCCTVTDRPIKTCAIQLELHYCVNYQMWIEKV